MGARRITRGAVIAVLVAVSAATTLSQASAQPPPPTNSADALQQFKDLSAQAEQLNEDLLQAKEDQKAKRAEADRAKAAAVDAKRVEDEAKATEEQFRGQVDQFSAAALNGARFTSMSALLTGDSKQDFLARASALKILATENNNVLTTMSDAVAKADQARAQFEQAQRTAEEAAAAADALVNDIQQRQTALNRQIAVVRAARDKLTATQKAALASPGDLGQFFGPPGAANTAVQAALAQRGKPYVWGASGPNSFDCSGLTMYSYARAGVSLPRTSRAQYGMGKPVAYGAWIPGDLLFYGSSASTIHHVAMYVGDGKIVHASTEGVPVKVDPVSGGGSDYFGARRVVG